ncbi:unnamed protein product [Nippostrongylus brasiliensis]|uniref:SHSP domain-containing protein n=1 Tax=Nippostrongylus brasiliensis TaxID=27835 RepID=A0A0N4XCB8_NIPBR|nr:unnamed protein product [Nippostrongylus brasiliensis]
MLAGPQRAARGVFREFDEDDLESYLEGSLLSERLGDEKIQNQIITVFPCTSYGNNYASGTPSPPALETIFTTTLETMFMPHHPNATSTYGYSPQTRPSYQYAHTDGKGVSVRRISGSSNNCDEVKKNRQKSLLMQRTPDLVSRPGSPGPVAGAGDVVNTPHGFTIQLDVVLTDDLLCVSGERIEAGSGGQTLKRSFARKYCIPTDIHLDSIRSHLEHNGVLVITMYQSVHCPESEGVSITRSCGSLMEETDYMFWQKVYDNPDLAWERLE